MRRKGLLLYLWAAMLTLTTEQKAAIAAKRQAALVRMLSSQQQSGASPAADAEPPVLRPPLVVVLKANMAGVLGAATNAWCEPVVALDTAMEDVKAGRASSWPPPRVDRKSQQQTVQQSDV